MSREEQGVSKGKEPSDDDIRSYVGYEAWLWKLSLKQLVVKAEAIGVKVDTLCYDTPQLAKRALILRILAQQDIDPEALAHPGEEEPEDYDPGPEVDDEGGMSEIRRDIAENAHWEEF